MEALGSAALLLFAIAGYVTLRHSCHYTKFRWEALAWEQNAFESAACGFALFLAVRLLVVLIPPLHESGAAQLLKSALPFPFSGSLVAAFAVGMAGGHAVNLAWNASRSHRRAVRNHGGDLRAFLHDAAHSGNPVALSMDTRKVYVGSVVVPPALREPSHVVLMPTLSGYRDETTRQVVFTTAYEEVYEDLLRRQDAGEDVEIDVDAFQIVLPLAAIASANLYDNDVYLRYFSGPPEEDEPLPGEGARH